MTQSEARSFAKWNISESAFWQQTILQQKQLISFKIKVKYAAKPLLQIILTLLRKHKHTQGSVAGPQSGSVVGG